MKNLPLADQKFVRQQLAILPPRITAAKDAEMAEMMGKLKEVSLYSIVNVLVAWAD